MTLATIPGITSPLLNNFAREVTVSARPVTGLEYYGLVVKVKLCPFCRVLWLPFSMRLLFPFPKLESNSFIFTMPYFCFSILFNISLHCFKFPKFFFSFCLWITTCILSCLFSVQANAHIQILVHHLTSNS